jgi:hypothetical protein
LSDTVDALVERWCREDHERALLPGDHEVIEATRAMRALVVAGIRGAIDARDLLHACWRLGNLVGLRGGSPTLLGSTLDGAHVAEEWPDRATGAPPARGERTCPWIAMRAALCEGFASARLDMDRAEAIRAWDYPSCAVRIDDETIAVTCGLPDDDPDVRSAWADRVASAAARAGVRRAYVSGREPVVRALLDSFAVVGIERVEGATESKSWLPWKRSRR